MRRTESHGFAAVIILLTFWGIMSHIAETGDDDDTNLVDHVCIGRPDV